MLNKADELLTRAHGSWPKNQEARSQGPTIPFGGNCLRRERSPVLSCFSPSTGTFPRFKTAGIVTRNKRDQDLRTR
jgi:hypothetical protein